jgi:predicted ferric reductase
MITFISSTRLKYFLPLNDIKLYHAVCAIVLGIAVIPHFLLHICGDFVEIEKKTRNKPKDAYVTVAWLTFANLTGLTGVILLLMFSIIIIPPLIPKIRQKKYEIFLHTHKLFYPALAVLLLHARTPDTKRWPYLVYLGIPILLFSIELIFRLYRFFTNKTRVVKIKYLKAGVLLMEINKPKKFNFRCGQYAQINIPAISKFQWHPFTIASSPYDDNLYFYVNPAGDWTRELRNLGKSQSNKN